MTPQEAYKKLDLARGIGKERVQIQFETIQLEMQEKIAATTNDRLSKVFQNRLSEAEEAYAVLLEHFDSPENDRAFDQNVNTSKGGPKSIPKKTLLISFLTIICMGILLFLILKKEEVEVVSNEFLKDVSLEYTGIDCLPNDCAPNCCILSFTDGQKVYEFNINPDLNYSDLIAGNTYKLSLSTDQESSSKCRWDECGCDGAAICSSKIVSFGLESNTDIPLASRNINDLSPSELMYKLNASSDIQPGRKFKLNLNKTAELENYFAFSLDCPGCSSISKISENEYETTTNRTGAFDIETFISDTRTGDKKSLGITTFESKPQIPNSNPQLTMRHWLSNVSNREGYKMQTKWTTYSNYEQGYGSTNRTVVNCLDELSNNGTEAKVRVCYQSFDPQNSDLELVQIFQLRNFGADGWKWYAVSNESIKVLN